MYWEYKVMKYVEKHIKNKYVGLFLRLCSLLANGGVVFGLALIIMYFFYKNDKKEMLYILLSLFASSFIINILLKPIFSRQRPFLKYESVIPLIKRPKDMSFPSGHTSIAFTFATAVFYSNPKFGLISYIYAFLVGFSRIYIQVHYPTDVIVGGIVGSLSSVAVRIIYMK